MNQKPKHTHQPIKGIHKSNPGVPKLVKRKIPHLQQIRVRK